MLESLERTMHQEKDTKLKTDFLSELHNGAKKFKRFSSLYSTNKNKTKCIKI